MPDAIKLVVTLMLHSILETFSHVTAGGSSGASSHLSLVSDRYMRKYFCAGSAQHTYCLRISAIKNCSINFFRAGDAPSVST